MIAHRTCARDAAENSLAGIAAAAAAGADAVEIDVRHTRERSAVCVHDRLLWRLGRRPVPVSLSSGASLTRTLRRHPGGLVTLTEALAACPPTLRPILDVKTAAAVGPTIDVVLASGRRDVAVWHRKAAALAQMQTALPWAHTALLRNTWSAAATRRYLADAAAAGATAVSLHQRAASPAAIQAARAAGLLAYVWVVTESGHRVVLDRGVDGVVTDWPALCRRLLSES